LCFLAITFSIVITGRPTHSVGSQYCFALWHLSLSSVVTWLLHFVLCGHPTPRCWLSQEHEASSLAGHFRSRPRAPGTHYHLTLDPAVLWTLSNDTSRPTCSDSLNLMPPAPLYLRTLRRYTNAILFIYLLSTHTHSTRKQKKKVMQLLDSLQYS